MRIKARGGGGIWHTQIVTQALCIAESGELFALLASLGLKITPAKGGKDRLRALLSLASPGKLVRVASRIGWHGDNTFVLPDEAFGALIQRPGLPENRIACLYKCLVYLRHGEPENFCR